MDVILNRRSVRKFDLTKKVTYDDMLDLCRYGEAAPSARRQKGREYIIIDDLSVIEKLSNISKGALILKNCEACIAVIGKDPNTLVTPDMQAQDLSAATENILLRATSKGIGSCWVGVYPIEERTRFATEILNVGNGGFVFSLIALGYPLEENVFYDASKLEDNMIHYNGY